MIDSASSRNMHVDVSTSVCLYSIRPPIGGIWFNIAGLIPYLHHE